MGTITLEILILLILILANGVFAMAEVAIPSSLRAKRVCKVAPNPAMPARAALELVEAPNRFLATVQVGITLIGIFAGAFGGATLSKQLANALREVPTLAPYASSIGLGVVVVAIICLSLIVGELVPKRIGMHSPETIASLVAVQREDGSWLLDGQLPLEEFREIFALGVLPDEGSGYQTLSGLVMHQVGRIPAVAESFVWDDLHFEIVDMDGNRIDKILVKRG